MQRTRQLTFTTVCPSVRLSRRPCSSVFIHPPENNENIYLSIAPRPALLLHQVVDLTNDQLAFLGEVVFGDLKVEGSGTLSYSARNIVVGTVARAEPAAEVAGLADGDTAEMSADT